MVGSYCCSFIIETHVITRRITCDQCHTKCICTILIDDLQWIDTISKRFTHLTSLRVTNQTVDKYGVERCLSGMRVS